jgi:protein SCO1
MVLRRWLVAWVILTSLVVSLAACQPSAPAQDFLGTDIRHETFGGPLALTDHNGVKRSLKDFRGQWVVLFFGYTHCPDVCPTTLGDTAAALRLMSPEDAKKVQVLFVSVDPERDTLAMLRDFVPYFHPDFLALTGTEAELAQAGKDFRIVFAKHTTAGVGGYLVDHTAGSYVLDPEGKLSLFLPFAMPAADMAHDLKLLMHPS